MKMSDLALLAASAAAVFLVLKARGLVGSSSGSTWTPWRQVASYDGYQYFNDGESGLVITPGGDYVLNGVVVWSPRGLG